MLAILIFAFGCCGASEELGLECRPGGPLAGIRGFDIDRPIEPIYPGGIECYQANYSPCFPLFDRQSQRKVWTAPDLPMDQRRPSEQVRVPKVLPYRGSGPFPVIRCGMGGPVFLLDCGELEPSLYAVRTIATVDRSKLRPFREPVYLALKVDDQMDGGSSFYRVRIGYADDFYSVAEIYFHAPEKRRYRAELWIDRGSTIDLLVNAISLDDAMAGVERRAWKKRRTLFSDQDIAALKASYSPAERAAIAGIPALTPDERWKRDASLWNWFPPLNSSFVATFFSHPEATEGADGKSLAEIEAELGTWEAEADRDHGLDHNLGMVPRYGKESAWGEGFLTNKKLGIRYTLSDLRGGRPLPDPYPYKDDGAGLYFPDPTNPGKGKFFCPIAKAVQERIRHGNLGWSNAARLWQKTRNEDIGRDVAILLARYAWQFPAIDGSSSLNFVARQPCYQDYDFRCQNRMSKSYWAFNYDHYLVALEAYDLIFEYLQGNQALADSLHRFIPSIRSPDDVTAFFDAYLVQHTAKRTLRGHDHTWKSAIATIGAVLGAPELTDAWVLPYARSLLPFVLNDTDPNGCKKLGSTSYSHGEGASEHAEALDRYVRAGGSQELSLLARTRRPLAQCEWALDIMVGGWDWIRVGDVTGPNGRFVHARGWAESAAGLGWRWGGEPRYAWILKHARGRKSETDIEWQGIERAAATVKRAPWLENRSRVIENWAGILETGLEHDDPRFRRAAYVRVGQGSGHSHDDMLDLHVLEGGLQAMIEGGQRSGYSKPNDKLRVVHNLVEVQGAGGDGEKSTWARSHVRDLIDAEGARTLEAVAVQSQEGSIHRRRIALADVDGGSGLRQFTEKEQLLDHDLPKGISPANSYLIDFYRVAGGTGHTYCFHGTVNDEFLWNATNVSPVKADRSGSDVRSEAGFLSIFEWTPESLSAGDSPETLQATWRMVRFERDTRGGVSEEALLGRNFEPESPRYYTRLHLLGVKDSRVLKGDVLQAKCAEEENSKDPGRPHAGYRWTCLFVRKLGEERSLQSVFVGIVEPYRGNPFIESARLLEIPANETDSLRAVAVELKLRGGRTDEFFADGRPENLRRFGSWDVSAEYAFLSKDGRGLRQATLSGGTLLEAPEIKLVLSRRENRATIVQAEHPRQTVELDRAWPCARAGEIVEIGNTDRVHTFTLAGVGEQGKMGSRLSFTRDAIVSMDAATGVAEYSIQPGDTVRSPAFVNVLRKDDGTFAVEANADVEVTIAGEAPRAIKVSELERSKGRVLLRFAGR